MSAALAEVTSACAFSLVIVQAVAGLSSMDFELKEKSTFDTYEKSCIHFVNVRPRPDQSVCIMSLTYCILHFWIVFLRYVMYSIV